MTDVLLSHQVDGGEIECVNGLMTMTDDHSVAVYLSMFGGNERDTGREDGDRLQWWANLSEPDPTRRYRSETQALLRSLPAVPANLKQVEAANERDLAWFVETGAATLVASKVSMPAVNSIKIEIRLDIDGETQTFEIRRHWSSQG